jgi:hypothetical protein
MVVLGYGGLLACTRRYQLLVALGVLLAWMMHLLVALWVLLAWMMYLACSTCSSPCMQVIELDVHLGLLISNPRDGASLWEVATLFCTLINAWSFPSVLLA